MASRDNWSSCAIPVSLHGDAVPAVGVGRASSKSFDVYSMQGILCNAWTSLANMYLFGLFEDVKLPGRTMEACWVVLIWSLRSAYLGTWPTHSADGVSYDTWPASSRERVMMGKPLAD